MRELSRSCPPRSPGIVVSAALLLGACGPSTWRNYLHDHEVEATRRDPVDAMAVLALVRDAAARGERIRAVGSGHSSAEVAQPSEGHEYVDVGAIDRTMRWDFYRQPSERYVRIGAGATIAEINRALLEVKIYREAHPRKSNRPHVDAIVGNLLSRGAYNR